jgi:Zn-dependent M28 family amino/carboxypeptidase
MDGLPESIVGNVITRETGKDVLNNLVDIGNRMAGRSGEHDGAALIKREFEDIGLDAVESEEFTIPGWWRGTSSLDVNAPIDRTFEQNYDIISLPGSPAATITGKLCDLGYGLPKDFANQDVSGKIVMVDSSTPSTHSRRIHRMEKYAHAVDAGAEGFLLRGHHEGCLPPTGGIRERGNTVAQIPSAGISRELGHRIARHQRQHDLEVTLSIDCHSEDSTSINTEGTIGPNTEKEILLTAHVDAHDISEGARDNGFGCALVCETARILSGVEEALETKVRFVVFGCEEMGLRGSTHWSDTRNLDRVKCVINLDGLGISRVMEISENTFGAITDTFDRAAKNHPVSIKTRKEILPHSDAWPFLKEGVPSVLIRSWSSDEFRGWGHTYADTIDKLDLSLIGPLAITTSTAIKGLAEKDVPIDHKTRTDIRDAMTDEAETELKTIGRWPYD